MKRAVLAVSSLLLATSAFANNQTPNCPTIEEIQAAPVTYIMSHGEQSALGKFIPCAHNQVCEFVLSEDAGPHGSILETLEFMKPMVKEVSGNPQAMPMELQNFWTCEYEVASPFKAYVFIDEYDAPDVEKFKRIMRG